MQNPIITRTQEAIDREGELNLLMEKHWSEFNETCETTFYIDEETRTISRKDIIESLVDDIGVEVFTLLGKGQPLLAQEQFKRHFEARTERLMSEAFNDFYGI